MFQEIGNADVPKKPHLFYKKKKKKVQTKVLPVHSLVLVQIVLFFSSR